MAHRGKIFPYLFEKDLSLPGNVGQWRAPWKILQTASFPIFTWPSFPFPMSEAADADYTAGTITWTTFNPLTLGTGERIVNQVRVGNPVTFWDIKCEYFQSTTAPALYTYDWQQLRFGDNSALSYPNPGWVAYHVGPIFQVPVTGWNAAPWSRTGEPPF